jgi:ubiquinone/menaquinone biosynthesis C-methylase UbiE
MDKRLQLRLQRQGWDRAATHYEASWQAPLDVARRVLLDRQPVRPGDRVLDVACGTGLLTHELARSAGSSGQVFGIDLSQAMVDAARSRQSLAGSASAHYVRMDAQLLEFPSASFDVVLCCFGLMYLPDPERALAEMRRVLRPGGRLGIAIWGERARCAWAPVFSIVDAEVASDVCPLFFRLGADGTLAQACRAADLVVTSQTRLMGALSHRDADEACDAMFLAGPAALAWSRFDEQVRARVRRCYLDAIEPWRNASAYALPAEFVCLQAHPR